MKKIPVVLFCLICICGCHHTGIPGNISENDLKSAQTAFNEVREKLKEDNGQLWNYSLYGPILLVDRDTRMIISNEKDNSGILKKQGELYTGRLPEEINIANTAINWNGKRWTMVALPLPDTKEERMNLIIHELYHRIQPITGFDSLFEIQSVHLDSKEGRIYLKLEMEALKQALHSPDPDVHIKNSLLFRQYRYLLFPEAKQAENSLEINEGLAEYTGSVLSGRTDEALRDHYASKIAGFFSNPTFVRSFAYYTVPVYGYFMQLSDRQWNLKISRNTNLSDFIIGFFNIIPGEPDLEDIKKAGEIYGMDSIVALETRRDSIRQVLIKKYRSVFLGDSILEISLENMNIGFNPGNIMPLDTLGTVYPNLRISDIWGILEVDSCGALVSSDWKKVTVSYPWMITDLLISGTGWKLKLNKGWKLDKQNTNYKLIKYDDSRLH